MDCEDVNVDMLTIHVGNLMIRLGILTIKTGIQKTLPAVCQHSGGSAGHQYLKASGVER